MSKHSPESSPQKLRGRIAGFNMSPSGHVTGALVETTTGTVQLNFSKHEAQALTRSLRPGTTIDVKVERECKSGDHPVYSLSQEEVAVKGTITRLNYQHRGKANGFHLDDGTFVHVKPYDVSKHDLHVGDVITASGQRHAGNDTVVLDVRKVERHGQAPVAAPQ